MDAEGTWAQLRARIHDLECQVDVDAATIETLEAEGVANRTEIAQLTAALNAARRIGAAIGILMANHQVSEATAFAAIRRVSQDNNIRIRDLAALIIEKGSLPGTQ